MSISIKYRGQEGLTTPYFRVKRMLDGYWWKNTATTAWIATPTADCNIVLTESSTIKGEYPTSTNTIVPAYGGIYMIYVYTTAGVLLCSTEYIHNPNTFTTLNIINEVQKRLLYPISTDVTNSNNAKILLSQMNEIQRIMLSESTAWDALKIRGSIQTVVGQTLYPLCPVNVDYVDKINSLKIGTDIPLYKFRTEEDFREYVRQQSSGTGQPLYYRIYNRIGGIIYIEVSPSPDAIYTADYEILYKPNRLTTKDEIPLLDSDLLIRGLLLLYEKHNGTIDNLDVELFKSELGVMEANQGDSNFGEEVNVY